MLDILLATQIPFHESIERSSTFQNYKIRKRNGRWERSIQLNVIMHATCCEKLAIFICNYRAHVGM